MKTVCKENMCVGCMACLEACNKSAITIKDTLKEDNALIDENLCVNCGTCYNICQNNKELKFLKSLRWFQGWSKDRREYSSSGGAAAEIISTFINQGGIVCSCAFKNGKFGFHFAPNEVSAGEYIGSKYVKSNPEGVYKKIKNLLKDNGKVLFLGLPCQVEAVKNFVGNKYMKNLYTVDLICHGSPSPKLLEMFLADYGLSLNELSAITFRNKTKFRLLPNVKELEPSKVSDTYTFAFLRGLDYTENCYHCRYARQERVSDITIGDSWGNDLLDEGQKGISLILCQTSKGEKLIQSTNMQLLMVDYDKAVESNHQPKHPSIMPKERERFFDMIDKEKKFKYAVAVCYKKFYMKQNLKKVLIKLGIIRGGIAEYGICVMLEQDRSNLLF